MVWLQLQFDRERTRQPRADCVGRVYEFARNCRNRQARGRTGLRVFAFDADEECLRLVQQDIKSRLVFLCSPTVDSLAFVETEVRGGRARAQAQVNR